MEFIPTNMKRKHLDFSRPTYNEPNIQLPENEKARPRLPSSFADDEESLNDCEVSGVQKAKNIENISVFLRLKPVKDVCSLYKFEENKVIIPQVSNQAVNTERHYTFSSIFSDHVNQIQIYNEIVRPILADPLSIRGSTFASYGVSNSGKTYTILGDSSPGIVPRAITQIFTEYKLVMAPFPCAKISSDQISILSDANVEYEIDLVTDYLNESSKLNKGKPIMRWLPEEINREHSFKSVENVENTIGRLYVWISFVEIYNEKITDLLNNQKNTVRPLKIFSNNGNSYIHGATWLFAENVETALSILSYGLNRIKYAATGINDHSSRSHTIFTINMIAESGMDYQFSSYKFCDLAGAERTKKTGNIGDRLKESGGINNSLLVLGRCLEAVQQNQSKVNKKLPDVVVPVRDSKLTFLLQSSLLGHDKFVMIVNICPNSEFFEENNNVLKFGSIASQIVVRKSEARIFKRKSSRYSYLMQKPSLLNNSLRNESLNGTIDEGGDESELDDSFKWSSMNNAQLQNELHQQKRIIEGLNKFIIDNAKEMTNTRRQILESQKLIQDRIEKRGEENEQMLKEYHEKKMENQRIRYERLLSEAYSEIEYLEKKLKKFKGEQNSDEESGESEEDVIEIDE